MVALYVQLACVQFFYNIYFYKVNKMCQIETIFDIVSKNLLTLFDNPAHLIFLFFYISRFGSF